MSRIHWGFVATAIFGLATTSAGIGAWIATPSAEPYADCEQRPSQQSGADQGRYNPTERAFDLSLIPGPLERIIANPPPCHGEDNEKRDLAAQEATAGWAFWMVVLSSFQIALNGLGLWALLRTIKQGERTLAVTQTSSEEARRIGEAQVKAYLSIISGEIRVSSTRAILSFSIKNTGQSPARATGYYAAVHPKAKKFDPRGNLKEAGARKYELPNIGSNVEECVDERPLPVNGSFQINERQDVVVLIDLIWRDVFNNVTRDRLRAVAPIKIDVDGNGGAKLKWHRLSDPKKKRKN